MDVDSITQLYQYLEPRVLLRLVTCSKSLLKGLTYELALRSIYRNGGPTAKSAVSGWSENTRLDVIKHPRTATGLGGYFIWKNDHYQGSKRCGPVVTVETVNRLIAQGSKAGLMPLLEDLFTKTPRPTPELLTLYERIGKEGEDFNRLNCEAKRQGRVKRESAKRQKTETIDAKLTELLSDAEWLPLARASTFMRQVMAPFQNAPSKATKKVIVQTAASIRKMYSETLPAFARLDFLDPANPFEQALRDYSLDTLRLGAESVRPSSAPAPTASSTAAANTSAATSTAALVMVMGAPPTITLSAMGSPPISTLSATGAPTSTLYVQNQHVEAEIDRGGKRGEPAAAGAETAEDLFLRVAGTPVYELIMEGNQLGAVVTRCFQQTLQWGETVEELKRMYGNEVKRVCGVMFANMVETRRGHSLAKTVLDASFDHHCVGDTITPNVWWLRLFKGGDDLEKMAVQLDKTFKRATELYPLVRKSALDFLSLDWMANLDKDAVCFQADDVNADPAWVARLETAVFGRHAETAASYGSGFTPIHDNFTPMAAAGLHGLVERLLLDTRKYELLIGQRLWSAKLW